MATKTKSKTKSLKKAEVSAPSHRPLVAEGNKLPPTKEIYNGFEIEARYMLLSTKEDYTKQKNGIELYDRTLQKGDKIEQGYILELFKAKDMLDELGIAVDFSPNTVRLRKYGSTYILTLKDRKATKRREVEWELDKKTFYKYWPLTKGARVYKTRHITKVKNHEITFDAFTDRFLLLAEIEVSDETILPTLPRIGNEITGQKEWTNKSLAK